MIRNRFRQHARNDSPDLNRLTTDLRRRIAHDLACVLTDSGPGGDEAQNTALRKLQQALDGGPQRFIFRYEGTFPLSDSYKEATFYEGLISLEDTDGSITHGGRMLEAFEGSDFLQDVGMRFRLWLIFAQITDFTMNSDERRLSINIMPQDTDSREFRETLAHGLKIARSEISSKLPKEFILEAVENDFWTRSRREFLKSMIDPGVSIAIDDYGAPEGYNQEAVLTRFNNGTPPGNLIVKLDGKLVRGFIEENDLTLVQKLAEIKEQCPGAIVVAEWVESVDEAVDLTRRLGEFGMGGDIHLVQSREIHDSSAQFLDKINGRFEGDGAPPPAPGPL